MLHVPSPGLARHFTPSFWPQDFPVGLVVSEMTARDVGLWTVMGAEKATALMLLTVYATTIAVSPSWALGLAEEKLALGPLDCRVIGVGAVFVLTDHPKLPPGGETLVEQVPFVVLAGAVDPRAKCCAVQLTVTLGCVLPGMRPVRSRSGQNRGQMGGGSLPSWPRMEMDPVMLTLPTVLKLAMPLPVCPGVFCTEITPVFELLKDVSRVTSEVLPSPHCTVARTGYGQGPYKND